MTISAMQYMNGISKRVLWSLAMANADIYMKKKFLNAYECKRKGRINFSFKKSGKASCLELEL